MAHSSVYIQVPEDLAVHSEYVEKSQSFDDLKFSTTKRNYLRDLARKFDGFDITALVHKVAKDKSVTIPFDDMVVDNAFEENNQDFDDLETSSVNRKYRRELPRKYDGFGSTAVVHKVAKYKCRTTAPENEAVDHECEEPIQDFEDLETSSVDKDYFEDLARKYDGFDITALVHKVSKDKPKVTVPDYATVDREYEETNQNFGDLDTRSVIRDSFGDLTRKYDSFDLTTLVHKVAKDKSTQTPDDVVVDKENKLDLDDLETISVMKNNFRNLAQKYDAFDGTTLMREVAKDKSTTFPDDMVEDNTCEESNQDFDDVETSSVNRKYLRDLARKYDGFDGITLLRKVTKDKSITFPDDVVEDNTFEENYQGFDDLETSSVNRKYRRELARKYDGFDSTALVRKVTMDKSITKIAVSNQENECARPLEEVSSDRIVIVDSMNPIAADGVQYKINQSTEQDEKMDADDETVVSEDDIDRNSLLENECDTGLEFHPYVGGLNRIPPLYQRINSRRRMDFFNSLNKRRALPHLSKRGIYYRHVNFNPKIPDLMIMTIANPAVKSIYMRRLRNQLRRRFRTQNIIYRR